MDKGVSSKNVGMQGSQTTVGSPISNEAYNVITALQAKLEGLEAYRKYARDGREDLWQQMMPMELQGVEMLITELEQIVKSGRLRTQQGH